MFKIRLKVNCNLLNLPAHLKKIVFYYAYIKTSGTCEQRKV